MLKDTVRMPIASSGTYFPSVQALRGVAALMVVLYHLVNAETVHGRGDPLLTGTLAEYGYAGVDLFFVISGFVMTTVMAGKYGSIRAAARFLLRRGLRIFPLYWLFTTLIVAMMLIRPATIDASYQDKGILASYLLIPQSTLPILQVGWTLIYEAFFYLMMAIAVALFPERRISTYFATWAVTLLVLQFIPWTSPSGQMISSPMGWEFIAGALIGIYWRRLPAGWAIACATVGIAGFTSGAVLLQTLDGYDSHAALTRTIAFGLPCAMVVLGLVRWENSGRHLSSRRLNAIGNASYSIYLSHLFALSIGARLWSMSGLNQTAWQHLGFIILMMIVCTGVGLACFRWIEKPLLAACEALIHRTTGTTQRV